MKVSNKPPHDTIRLNKLIDNLENLKNKAYIFRGQTNKDL